MKRFLSRLTRPVTQPAAEPTGDYQAALTHWQAAREANPADPTPYLKAGLILLRHLDRRREADQVLADGTAEFPQHIELAAEYALCAQYLGDPAEIVRRYQRAQELDPEQPYFVSARAGGLRALRRFDEAEALLHAALGRFGPHPLLLTEQAWVAQDRGDHDEALRRWVSVRTRFPDQPIGWRMTGQTLAHLLGRPAEGERALAAAAERFPDDADIGMEHAKLPALAGNWDESLRRWSALALRFPSNARVTAGRGDAELKVMLGAIDTANSAADGGVAISRTSSIMAVRETGSGSGHRALMMGFESLGANCEFGLVQRHYGAEPLGLLRWNSIQPEQLAQALEQRFEGVGEPGNVRLGTPETKYDVVDLRYNMVMHSFLNEDDTTLSPDRLLLQFARRMRFLRDKLLQDLAAAEKLFVYQFKRLLTEQEMARLQAALESYGPNTMLYVNDVTRDREVGHVEQLRPGCLVGYVDRLVRTEGWGAVSVAAWLAVCENAAKLRRPGR